MRSIGWVVLDGEGDPYRPMLGDSYWARRKPTTVYQTKTIAERYGAVVSEVFINDSDKDPS
jgi:hypothetical protein